ncbi:MAG: hypothetical protein LBS33_05800 [Streptococcaceae bacterium]|jgi:hypothetical protein|nr:hypothetical protein [Streptococcaceae bacterium]
MKPISKNITWLVVAIALIAGVVAAISLFDNTSVNVGAQIKTISGGTVELYGKGIYHNDSLSMAVQAKGQDLVTLFIGVPFLIYALFKNRQNSIKGRFYLTGALAYFLYTYTIYCLAGTFNSMFVLYVILMSLSFYSFLACMTSFELSTIHTYFQKKLPIKYLSISNLIFAFLIGMNWLSYLIPQTTALKLEHYTTFPVQAMDLGIILPAIVFSSIMLLRKHNWGYLLLPILMFKALTLLLALDAMIIFMLANGVEVSIAEQLIFPIYTLIVGFNFYLIQKNIRNIIKLEK